jgi:serine/threonine protein kinase
MSICPRCQTDHLASGGKCPAEPVEPGARLGQACTLVADDETSDPLLRTKVGDWTILEPIGGGGMGTVYLAKNLEINIQVAVKVMRLDGIVQSGRTSTFREELQLARERFLREAKIVAQLGKNNPGIVQIVGYGHLPDGRPYMVMEYLYGRSLDKWLEQGLPPAHDLRRWLVQLCDALASIHGAGVVHRDLKPENIWIAEPETGPSSVKLIDFGISKATDNAPLTKVGEIAGSPGYMSPERISGNPGDLRSDLYAVGVLLYEIVTGRLPFAADSVIALAVKIRHDPPPPPSPRAGFVLSSKLEALILDCLAKEPEQRPQSALELKQRLLDALDSQDQPESPVGSIPRLAPAPDLAWQPPVKPNPSPEEQATAVHIAALTAPRRHRIVAGLFVLLVLAGGGYVLWKYTTGSRLSPSPSSRAVPAAPPPVVALPPAATPSPAAKPSPSSVQPAERIGGTGIARTHAPAASARARGRAPSHGEHTSSPLQPEPQAAAQPEAALATRPVPSAAAHVPEPQAPTPAAGEIPEWIPRGLSRPLSPSERDLITDEKTLIGR